MDIELLQLLSVTLMHVHINAQFAVGVNQEKRSKRPILSIQKAERKRRRGTREPSRGGSCCFSCLTRLTPCRWGSGDYAENVRIRVPLQWSPCMCWTEASKELPGDFICRARPEFQMKGRANPQRQQAKTYIERSQGAPLRSGILSCSVHLRSHIWIYVHLLSAIG